MISFIETIGDLLPLILSAIAIILTLIFNFISLRRANNQIKITKYEQLYSDVSQGLYNGKKLEKAIKRILDHGDDLSGMNLSNKWLPGLVLKEQNLYAIDFSYSIFFDLNSDPMPLIADFSMATLIKANLVGADLSFADLGGANLADANLTNAILMEADLEYACLVKANFTGANLIKAKLFYAEFFETNFTGANLIAANITDGEILGGTSFREANLTNANLRGTEVCEADFTGANLTGANLYIGEFSNACFIQADLTNANLQEANFARTNFMEADLTNANLTEATFVGVDLTMADLTNADLTEADFTEANIDAEQLSTVKTLYKAKLDPELMEYIKEKYPHLLKPLKKKEK